MYYAMERKIWIEKEEKRRNQTPQEEWDSMEAMGKNFYLRRWIHAGRFIDIVKSYNGKIYGDGGKLVFPDTLEV